MQSTYDAILICTRYWYSVSQVVVKTFARVLYFFPYRWTLVYDFLPRCFPIFSPRFDAKGVKMLQYGDVQLFRLCLASFPFRFPHLGFKYARLSTLTIFNPSLVLPFWGFPSPSQFEVKVRATQKGVLGLEGKYIHMRSLAPYRSERAWLQPPYIWGNLLGISVDWFFSTIVSGTNEDMYGTVQLLYTGHRIRNRAADPGWISYLRMGGFYTAYYYTTTITAPATLTLV